MRFEEFHRTFEQKTAFNHALILVAALLAQTDWSASAQMVYDQLRSFGNSRQSGAGRTGLVLAGGRLVYGTTERGGAEIAGTAFKMNLDGSDYEVVHSFSWAENDGRFPDTPMVLGRDGALYGSLKIGGTNRVGNLVKISSDASQITVLRVFNTEDGLGWTPNGLIQGRDGALYGTTEFGGPGGSGTAFKVNPDGSGYTILHAFANSTGEASSPGAALIQGTDGALYGTTQFGGSNGYGTVFRLSTDGSGYTVLWNFDSRQGDGSLPNLPLLQGNDGALYGTTSSGSGTSFHGTIFKLNTDGSGFKVLHAFGLEEGNGTSPRTALIQGNDGMLYGASYESSEPKGGLLFRLNTDGSGFNVLKRFNSFQGDGKNPTSLIKDLDGTLYGATSFGGSCDEGTLFRIKPDGTDYAVVRNLNYSGGDGRSPDCGMIQGMDQMLYGVTYAGGSNDVGTVFRIATDGSGYELLHSFTQFGDNGQRPCRVIEGADGNLYGTTQTGVGSTNCTGTIFKLRRDGSGFAVVHLFERTGGQSNSDAQPPFQASDGSLYGTTFYGGSNNSGIIYAVRTDGDGFRVLHYFGESSVDGYNPYGTLIQGIDKALYGTTFKGGTNKSGTVYKIMPDGSGYITLLSFPAISGGPVGGVVQGRDGSLFGATSETVYKLNPDGSGYSVLHSFSFSDGDGCLAGTGLIEATDGVLYGTTRQIGNEGRGTVFSVTGDGSAYTVLRRFTATGGDGDRPYSGAGLLQARDGAIYGTTIGAGTQNQGIIFSLATAASPSVIDHPQSQTVLAGANVTFWVTASGGNLDYQWLLNGAPILAATNNRISVLAAARTDAGSYSVEVKNSLGKVVSYSATLSVRVPLRLTLPVLLADKSISLTAEYSDGWLVSQQELVGFEAQTSSDLFNWVTLPDSLAVRDGALVMHGTWYRNELGRFYRIIQR